MYAELHARSAFSFLRGACNPEDLVKAACHHELPAMALLDRDGVCGAARFFGPARENGLRARVGGEVTMEDGSIVPLLATSQLGYQNLCQLITEAKLTERTPPVVRRVSGGNPTATSDPHAGRSPGTAGVPPAFQDRVYDRDLLVDPHAPDPRDRKRPCFATWDELARYNDGLIALTGDEDGPIRRTWRTSGAAAVHTPLQRLLGIFGHDRLYVELQRHRLRGEDREITFLRDLAAAHNLPLLATGGVNYAVPSQRATADVFTCLRLHSPLDTAGRRLALNSERHVKSAREMALLFRDLPAAIENTVRLE